MHPEFSVRRANVEDLSGAYAVFRRSILDYLFRIGLVDEGAAKNPPLAESWQRQASWIKHLWNTCAENWVAADPEGQIIGWALSIERDGHLELSALFVDPTLQSKGLGHALITKAFPSDRGEHRTINALQDPRALSLYLRSGVNHVTISVDLTMKPGVFVSTTDLVFERLDGSETSINAVVGLERAVLGFSREVDIRFIMAERPAWLGLRDGQPVAYAFGVQPNPPEIQDFLPACGPMAALDPADMPALIDHVIGQACDIGEFSIAVPLMNHLAVAHLLKRGGKIDPFYVMILSDDPTLKLDRYVHTSPAFIL